MSNIFIDSGAVFMKKFYLTALLAVFLSLVIAGCYTKLKGPEPYSGERSYYDDYYYPGGYYPYGFYTPYYFHLGWYSPYFFGSPYFYGNFYSPWWYDPYYYYDGGYYNGIGRSPGDKGIRRRRGGTSNDLPPVPGSSYSAPAPPPQTGGDQGYNPTPPARQDPPSGNGDSKNSGKSTRQRR